MAKPKPREERIPLSLGITRLTDAQIRTLAYEHSTSRARVAAVALSLGLSSPALLERLTTTAPAVEPDTTPAVEPDTTPAPETDVSTPAGLRPGAQLDTDLALAQGALAADPDDDLIAVLDEVGHG